MWRQFLSKASVNAKIDLDSCNMEYRPQMKGTVSYEKALKSNEIILDLSNKSLAQLDELTHSIPGQFSKEFHIKAAYYDLPMFEQMSERWQNLVGIQTDCTVRWLQNKFIEAKTDPNWDDNIWFDAKDERNNAADSGAIGEKWHKFVERLNIGPYITHPWTPKLAALITNEIIKFIQDTESDKQMKILDVGCGIGEFGEYLNDIIEDKTKLKIDGVDRTINDLSKIKCKLYRYPMGIDLCNQSDIKELVDFVVKGNEFYDVIVSSDCLQMVYGNDYAPGCKTVKDLMDLVKDNGYFLIVNTLQTVATYKIACIYDDILKESWNEHGFECLADVVVRGFGDIDVKYNSEHEQNSIENNICFVKLMKRVINN